MFQLLSLWGQYVDVIYMPESEIHVLSAVEKMDARPDSSAYGLKAEESNIRSRLNTLFAPEVEAAEVGEEKIGGDQADYETVNEGMTTDTTEAPNSAVRRGELAKGGEESHEGGRDVKEEKVLEEGILSSDEEEVAQEKKKDKPIMKVADNDIRAFQEGGKQEDLYTSHKLKEDLENKFNYGEQDIEHYGARLQSKADRSVIKATTSVGDD